MFSDKDESSIKHNIQNSKIQDSLINELNIENIVDFNKLKDDQLILSNDGKFKQKDRSEINE